jgi:hypothetical protein
MTAAGMAIGMACRSGATAPTVPAPEVARNTARITLGVERLKYEGDTIAVVITSRDQLTYGFNPCNRIFKYHVDTYWLTFDEGLRICTQELWLLKPGQTITAIIQMPSDVTAGEYRLLLAFWPQRPAPRAPADTAVWVSSRSFSLRP